MMNTNEVFNSGTIMLKMMACVVSLIPCMRMRIKTGLVRFDQWKNRFSGMNYLHLTMEQVFIWPKIKVSMIDTQYRNFGQ